MNYSTVAIATAALVVLLLGCQPAERGASVQYEREIDAVHARNRDLHQASLELDQRLARLAESATALRQRLEARSDEGARDLGAELASGLEQAESEVTKLRAAIGADWQSLELQARDALDQLEQACERARAALAEGSEPDTT